MRFKLIYKNGEIAFMDATNEATPSLVFITARRTLKQYPNIKQIDMYEKDNLIASIYG